MNPTPQSVRVITLNLRAGKLHGFNVAGRAGCQGLGFRVEGGFKEDRVPICVLLHHGGFDGVSARLRRVPRGCYSDSQELATS